jgi:hypothetical protein
MSVRLQVIVSPSTVNLTGQPNGKDRVSENISYHS